MKSITRSLLICLIGLLMPAVCLGTQTPWIFGMHDPGGESNAVAKGKRIWIVFTEAIGHNPSDTSGKDFSSWSNAGHGVIVRLNNGYSYDGTLPYQSEYQNFAARCANYVKASKGVDAWIIGNECNLPREWPGNSTGDPSQGEPITVARYVDCYNKCYAAIKAVAPTAQLCPTPSGTWAPPYTAQGIGGFLDYWVGILNGIGASKIDALALHCYTHGCDPNLVFSEGTMGAPYYGIYYNFRVYKNYMNEIPADMHTKPVYITECDENIECADPPPQPRHTWANTNSGWVKNIYSEINSWNSTPDNQKIRCVALFRWPDVAEGEWSFGISNRSGVVNDWREAMDNDYKWDLSQTVRITKGPYIEECSAASVTIYWETDVTSTSQVDYGTTTSYGSSQSDSTLVTTHRVTLTGLTQNTTYHYQVTSSKMSYMNGVSADFTFITAPSLPRPFVNASFETGSLSPWVSYGQTDGIQTGPWFNSVMPHQGTYMVGSATNGGGSKNGGIYQRCSVNANGYYRLSGWGYTWQQGGVDTDDQVRFGMDPTGQLDPYSANISWGPWWGAQGSWSQNSLVFRTSNPVVTVFAEMKQTTGLVWNVTCLDDFTLTEIPAYSIESAKALPDGTMVSIPGRIVTAGTSSVGNAFYIEEPDRQSGIRVQWSQSAVTEGSVIDVVGTLATTASGERCVTMQLAPSNPTGGTMPKPFGMRLSSLAGGDLNANTKGATGRTGVNNVGLLIRTFGNVKTTGSGYFTIDDGFGTPLKVYSSAAVSANDHVGVTGVVSLEGSTSSNYPVVITRTGADVTKY